MRRLTGLGLVLALCFAAGCDDDGGTDAGLLDSGAGRPDSGAMDAGAPIDSGGADSGAMDAAAMDAAAMDAAAMDAAAMDAAGADSGADAAADAGGSPDGIADVRAAAPGMLVPALPVRGVTVTYLRPQLGSDPAGFFVQSGATGPALFVALDPASTTPTLAVGDVIDFDVTQTAIPAGHHRVIAISGLVRSATGVAISGLVQDLSAATDVVSALDDYESELVSFTGTLSGAEMFAGLGHTSMRLVTAGVDDPSLVFRTTDAIFVGSMLRDGCVVDIGPSPLWRLGGVAQAMGYVAGDLSVTSCPPIIGVAPGAGDVVITELVTTPTDGELIEIHNPSTTTTYNLNGCTLYDGLRPGNDALVGGSIQLDPGAYVVLSRDAETAPVSTLPFGLNDAADVPGIECGSPAVTVDEVDYGAMGFPPRRARISIQLRPTNLSAADNDSGGNWCVTPPGNNYGTMGGVGTPGAANVTCAAPGGPAVIFTEYLEGSSNNKALEITNTSAAPADLSTCEIRLWSNGRSPAMGPPSDVHNLAAAGVLAAGASHVLCHPSSRPALLAVCDELDGGPTGFNGDDALELFCAGAIVDSIGRVGERPAGEWSGGGVGTQNETLRRINCIGDTMSGDAYDPSVDWASLPIDTFAGLGAFACP